MRNVALRAQVAVLGIGYSPVTRGNDSPTLGEDAVMACRRAIADAGITVDDVDGLTTYKYRPDGHDRGMVPAESIDGTLVVSPQYMWRRLGLPQVRWGEWNDKFIGSSMIEAHNAIAGGACRYALVWRAVNYVRGVRYGLSDVTTAAGDDQFNVPYGWHGGPQLMAPLASRYYQKYGATREHMARFVVTLRDHALQSGRGYWAENRPEKLTVEDYLAARMIAEPFGLYDCDLPVQGCVAYLLGPAEAAKDLDHGAAFIAGFAQSYGAAGGSSTFLHLGGAGPDGFFLERNLELGRKLADDLWTSTGLTPGDIATANLYDGFSILAWGWLEALGFCGEGEAFEFVQDGRITHGGQLPLNTSGGNLGEGRLAGAPHLSESILQAMGRAGDRQVRDARYTLAATDRVAVGQAIIFGSETSPS